MPWLLIKKTITSELPVIFFYCLNTFVITLIFGLTYSFSTSLYPLVLSIVILGLYLTTKGLKYKAVIEERNNLRIANHQLGYIPNSYDQLYIEVIDQIHSDYSLKTEEMIGRNRRNEQLLSQFFHNMKTSVAVIELASSRDQIVINDIRFENDKLKHQLEQSLNVLRLDRFVDDYMPEQLSLLELVQSVINDNKSNFIYNHVYPKVSGADTIIFTDNKWCKYLLEQLVSNAIKYSHPNTNVEFILEPNKLTVRDYGIGIETSEINRIFELFYTGTNGRNNKQSTGIGLAMVKTVAEMLDIEVEVTSVVNQGTSFKLTFLV